MFLAAGRLKPKRFQRRFAYFLDEEKVGRRRLDTPKIRFIREVYLMASNEMARFTLRIPKHLLDQLGYIAEYEGRTKNKELEQMIKARIAAFEKEQGKIPEN